MNDEKQFFDLSQYFQIYPKEHQKGELTSHFILLMECLFESIICTSHCMWEMDL